MRLTSDLGSDSEDTSYIDYSRRIAGCNRHHILAAMVGPGHRGRGLEPDHRRRGHMRA